TGYGDRGSSDPGALEAHEGNIASALMASTGFTHMSSGFAGVNDGYRDLLLHHRLTLTYARADSGNVVHVAQITRPAHFTLALVLGTSTDKARTAAQGSLARGF